MAMRGLTKRNQETGLLEWIDPKDRAKISKWMETDIDHKGMSPDLFLEERTESIMFSDEAGDIFTLRLSRVVRVDIQFNTEATPEMRERIGKGLLRYFPWLMEYARRNKFRQLIFDSISPALIRFCGKRFGFKSSPKEYVTGV